VAAEFPVSQAPNARIAGNFPFAQFYRNGFFLTTKEKHSAGAVKRFCKVFFCLWLYDRPHFYNGYLLDKKKNVYRMIDIDLMHVTNHAIDLYRHLQKKGITIRKSMDCLIASYAIIANMYLLHDDSDFTQIASESKLKIYNNILGELI
jgi:hypothetical protein